jgi:hypothetical protein
MTTKGTERVWCSEILSLQWESRSGRPRTVTVNLEEIGQSSALFLSEEPIPSSARLRFACGGSEFRGRVIAQTFSKGLGYFVEMAFARACRWSPRLYRPKHFLNPLIFQASRFLEAALSKRMGVPGNFPLKSPFSAVTPPRRTVRGACVRQVA